MNHRPLNYKIEFKNYYKKFVIPKKTIYFCRDGVLIGKLYH